MNLEEQLLGLDLSKMHIYSFGIVVECNKGSAVAKVFPVEKLWDKSKPDPSDLKKTKKTDVNYKKYTLKDEPNLLKEAYEKKEVTIKLEESKFVYAKWLQHGQSNRVTPPDLGIGEKVLLYSFGNNDELYWTTIDTDSKLRKNETVTWSFMKDSGSYSCTVDAGGGVVTVDAGVTNDGDACTWSVIMNPSDGYFVFGTDSGGPKEQGGDMSEKFNLVMLDHNKNAYFNNVKKLWRLKTQSGHVEIHMQKGIMVSNGGDELIKWMIDLMTALLAEQHIGNLGRPTPLTGDSVSRYQALLQRIKKFQVKSSGLGGGSPGGGGGSSSGGPAGGNETGSGKTTGVSNPSGNTSPTGNMAQAPSASDTNPNATKKANIQYTDSGVWINGQLYDDPNTPSGAWDGSGLISDTPPPGSKNGDVVGTTDDGKPEVVWNGIVVEGEKDPFTGGIDADVPLVNNQIFPA